MIVIIDGLKYLKMEIGGIEQLIPILDANGDQEKQEEVH